MPRRDSGASAGIRRRLEAHGERIRRRGHNELARALDELVVLVTREIEPSVQLEAALDGLGIAIEELVSMNLREKSRSIRACTRVNGRKDLREFLHGSKLFTLDKLHLLFRLLAHTPQFLAQALF